MTGGDEVVYQADPWLYGIGTIAYVRPDGRLAVVWPCCPEDDPQIHEGHELVLAAEWLPAQMA